jgi:hypothetical protein
VAVAVVVRPAAAAAVVVAAVGDDEPGFAHLLCGWMNETNNSILLTFL